MKHRFSRLYQNPNAPFPETEKNKFLKNRRSVFLLIEEKGCFSFELENFKKIVSSSKLSEGRISK